MTTMVALLERGVRNAERGMKGDDPFVEEVTEQIRVLKLVPGEKVADSKKQPYSCVVDDLAAGGEEG